MADIKVASLFAALGLKPDRKAWAAGQKLIEGMRDAVGRFTKRAALALAGVGIGATVLGDKYTELENRIRQVSSSNEELNQLMDRTRAIANATRSDWKSTGEAFVRLKNATKDMGVSTDRALKLVETLNMALQSSGASASEAAAGTLQLMQGLASGALQGDEFRSIAEQLPDLMDLFAKELHVSRGELKKLGAEGKITSKVVVNALEHASGSIRDKFAASTATAGQRWIQLKNSLMLASAEFIRATGLGEALAHAVQRISSWIEGHRAEIRAFGAAVGKAFGVAYDAVAAVVNFLIDHGDAATAVIVALTAVVTAFSVAAAAAWVATAAPIIAIIAGITAIVYAGIKLARHWDTIKAKVTALGRTIKGVFVGVGSAIAAPFIAGGRLIKAAFMAVVDFIAAKVEWIVNKAKAAADAVGNAVDFINPFGSHQVSPEQFNAIRKRFGVPGEQSTPSVPRASAGASAGGGGVTVGSVDVGGITVQAAPNMNEQHLANKVGEAVDQRIRTAFANVGATRGAPG